ncbi:hypothetical protein RKE38_10465 [Phycicoccus sp. M110.8]|uniref:hypothetical protein n=1 Tax=Phycicoccus sp. M110.8 TaxID=3075433 RepID=UPI0028FD9039|nr:hypothetical protein [Phycicoccus sp. M110.8]MDU0314108.1 hypothetical protein [Phycicoccus sp. M110.8]
MQDSVARGIAAASAVIAMTTLAWSVLSWRLAGPTLRIHCLAYREELTIRVFNAGRTAESLEHIVLGGRKGGARGLDLTAHLGLPMRLEPGQTGRWRLNPSVEPLAGRWRQVTAGWCSLWVLTGSMRQPRVEVIPLPQSRPPVVGWRLVPRRSKLARYATLLLGVPVAFVAAVDLRPVATYAVVWLAIGVVVRAIVAAASGPVFVRRRVERWALGAASALSVIESFRATGRPTGTDMPTVDYVSLMVLAVVGMTLATPGLAADVAAGAQLLTERLQGLLTGRRRRNPSNGLDV